MRADADARPPGDVLVAGATGLLGGAVCRKLVERGRSVRGLVRPGGEPARRERLEALGVVPVAGDLERPASLAACLEGAAAVVTTASAFPHDPRPDAVDRVDRDGQLALVDAAAAAGVGRVVYVSFPPAVPDFPFQRAKRSVEERLRAVGVEHVILQPGKFMDVWFSAPLGLDLAARRIRVYGDGTAPQSWIAVDDVAEAAARSVEAAEPPGAGRPVAFGGPAPASQLEVAGAYEQALGIELEREAVTVASLEAMRREAANATEESLAAILLSATEPDVIDPAGARALGLRPASVADFVRRQTEHARLPAV